MATAAERTAAMRARRRRGEVQVMVVLSERELAKIAQRGYAGAASTDDDARAEAVGIFVSDSLVEAL
jgi:hypothetical protein